MPMLNLKCSKAVPPELVAEMSSVVAETIGKPEKFVMVAVSQTDLLMGGTADAAAHAEVKSIGGLDRVVNHEITMKLCLLMEDWLGIPQDRVYVTFQSVDAAFWGWNGKTFG